jgi:hypothetical protein
MTTITQAEAVALGLWVDRAPVVRGAGILIITADGTSHMIRPPAAGPEARRWVVYQETTPPPRESRTGSELIGVLVNCGAFGFWLAADVAGAGAAPLTGGLSAVLTLASVAGTAASAIQCGVSAGRFLNEVFQPEANDWLDHQPAVQSASKILDGVALLGGTADIVRGTAGAIRLSRAAGRPVRQLGAVLTRAARKRLAQDISRYDGVAATRRQFIRQVRIGAVPKIISVSAVQAAIRKHLLEAAAAALSPVGSARDGILHWVVGVWTERGRGER